MNNRRTFLKHAGIGMAAAYLGPSLFACSSQTETTTTLREIGLQLYSLRYALANDVVSTLRRVAAIGYNHVETFGAEIGDNGKVSFWGTDVPSLMARLGENNLQTHSGHYDLEELLTPGNGNLDTLKVYIDTAAALGQRYLIAPTPPFPLIDKLTAGDYRFMADQLNAGGELAAKSGLKIGFHNHFWEFRMLDNGSRGLDILIENTDEALVVFELDLFWSEKSGIDSTSYLEKYPGRFPLWHIKDMDKANSATIVGGEHDARPFAEITADISYTEVGTGSIDFKKIMAKGDIAGLQHAFVEQDVITIDPFESIAESYGYVKNQLLGSS